MTIWTYVVGWTLVHFVWQGAAIALVTGGLLRLQRTASATTRYATACAGLVCMVIAALITGAILVNQTGVEQPAMTLVSSAPLAADSNAVVDTSPTRTVATSQMSPAVTIEAILPLLVPVWLIGVAVFSLRLVAGAWRVCRSHRLALTLPPSRWFAHASRVADALGLRRTPRVVDAAMVQTPTVVGWLRPVILLPIATLASLSAEQVDAILAHELAHIRRHDYLLNLLQVLAETLLFYHPAVWWMSACIRVEREHCCDDTAITLCGDPLRYAEALTELASWNSSSAPLMLAATNGSLLGRVQRILRPSDGSTSRARQSVAIAVSGLMFVIGGLTLAANSDRAAPRVLTAIDDGARRGVFVPAGVNRLLGYELFPVPKPLPTDDPRGSRAWEITIDYAGGRMPFMGFTARGLIRYAYNLSDVAVMDGPAWLDAESLSLTTALPATSPDDDDFRFALRTMLEQRLHLVTHHETREFPAYALVLANGALGPHARRSDSGCFTATMLREYADARRLLPNGQRTRLCGIEYSFFGHTGYGVTTADLARSLRQLRLGRDIVDRTGVSTPLDYSLRLGPLLLAAVATTRPAMAKVFAPLGVVPLGQALEEQLGMRLDETMAPYDVLVIDRVDRPVATADAPPATAATPRTLQPRLVRVPWAGAVESLAQFAAPAQVAMGEVAGRVVDQFDGVLPAVEVSLVAAGGRRTATTDGQGDFTFSNVPPGHYTLFATLPGFRDFNIGVDVRTGVTSHLTVPMAIGMIQETLTVVSNAEPRPPVSRPRDLTVPPPLGNGGSVQVGGNIRPPRVAGRVWPTYPPGAAANGVQGIVILTAVIGSDGLVNNVHVLSSPNAELSQAAEDAVQQWEFDPTLLDGVPVETLMQVTVDFQLSQ